MAGAYDEVGLTLTLTFDRAIDVAGLDGTQVVVEDGQFTLTRYAATGGVTVLGPTQVRLGLVDAGPFSDVPAVLLNATADSGIVAVAPPVGGTWAGESGLELPFPA